MASITLNSRRLLIVGDESMDVLNAWQTSEAPCKMSGRSSPLRISSSSSGVLKTCMCAAESVVIRPTELLTIGVICVAVSVLLPAAAALLVSSAITL